MRRCFAVLLTLIALTAGPGQAQDSNLLFPVDTIVRRMRDEALVVLDLRGSRAQRDRTQRVTLRYPDSSVMIVKWAQAAPGGSTFNNEPRYEIAAYELQRLFLDQADYVVPPTIARAVPLEWLRQYDATAEPTFGRTSSVVMVMQYWLSQVTNENFYDRARFESDSVYARHFADFNILTYLVRHNDSNIGNFLISLNPAKPRVFSVDNGVAFRSEASDRGFTWRDLRVDRLPHATVERLRRITREDLERTLGVIAHFEIHNGELIYGEATANLAPNRGVRKTDHAVQFGLTTAEIRDIERRLRQLLERVDEKKLEVF